jgi:hypothetical protein
MCHPFAPNHSFSVALSRALIGCDDAGFQDARMRGWLCIIQAIARWTYGEERRMIGIPRKR